MKTNIIKYIILIIIINITDFLSGKSYCNYYNNYNNKIKMYSLDRERNHKSIMNNSLIIENKPMKKPIVKKKPMKKPILNNNFKRIDINHHIKKKEYHHVNKIKISLKKRIYNFFYKRKNYALIKCFFLKKNNS
ncbi:hypothetical protein [Candidatus Karelsulcia muelleri]|uniref:hypothetical protein n=1 Tax=Candidatus Karelsulcia muelleri TaxID=336810 RepID=UPI000B926FFA|nr:hypothetical protein [Candidatus Karelsulcia muelleri]